MANPEHLEILEKGASPTHSMARAGSSRHWRDALRWEDLPTRSAVKEKSFIYLMKLFDADTGTDLAAEMHSYHIRARQASG